MDLPEILSSIDGRLDSALSPGRALHSRRVARLAASICAAQGINPMRGEMAGLAHDICKELPRREQNLLAREYPHRGIGKGEESSFIAEHIPHGPAAAAWLMREYGLDDTDILEAIALHTVGDPGMGTLAAIVYCADKLEPGRRDIIGAFRDRCLALPIPDMLASVCLHSIEWLRKNGLPVAPQTIVLHDSLLEKADRV